MLFFSWALWTLSLRTISLLSSVVHLVCLFVRPNKRSFRGLDWAPLICWKSAVWRCHRSVREIECTAGDWLASAPVQRTRFSFSRVHCPTRGCVYVASHSPLQSHSVCLTVAGHSFLWLESLLWEVSSANYDLFPFACHNHIIITKKT